MKKALCMALAFALVFALAGCHGSYVPPVEPGQSQTAAQTQPSEQMGAFRVPDTFDESRHYEITFWAKNDTNINQVEIYKKAIADFEALYPNITVKLKLYTDYGRIYNDVITNIATSTTPNVCITYPDHIATYLTGDNVVVPLRGLFAHEKYGLGGSQLRYDGPARDEMIPQFLKECVIGSEYYAIPFMRSTEACYINKTYVEALGYTLPKTLTWDFIWEVSEAATKKDAEGNFSINNQKVMIPFIYKSTDNMMIQVLKQQNAGYSTAEGDIEIFNDTTKAFLYTIAEHAKTGAFSTFKISSYPGNFLNAGQCIFAVDSTAGASWLGSNAPLSDIAEEKKVQFETVVRPIPQFDPEHPVMISQGPSVCIFDKADPQEVLASWLFAQFLLTDEVQISYAQTEGYVPVTSKARETDVYQEYLKNAGTDNDLHYYVKLDATKLLLENTENTFVTPVFNGSASLRDAAGQMVENTANAIRRKQTVDEQFMDNLYKDVEALYRLDQIGAGGAKGEKTELGPLPTASVVLLCTLTVVWLFILIYVAKKTLISKKYDV